jgi:hypothetical protein
MCNEGIAQHSGYQDAVGISGIQISGIAWRANCRAVRKQTVGATRCSQVGSGGGGWVGGVGWGGAHAATGFAVWAPSHLRVATCAWTASRHTCAPWPRGTARSTRAGGSSHCPPTHARPPARLRHRRWSCQRGPRWWARPSARTRSRRWSRPWAALARRAGWSSPRARRRVRRCLQRRLRRTRDR